MDIKEILEKHKKWLNNEEGGKIADLEGANLEDADLRGANLRGANLRYADLRYADLRDANLGYANLRYANLVDADLVDANLRGADLRYADLEDRFITINCIGSRKDGLTYNFNKDKVWCGCFTGNLEEFRNKVNETHKNNEKYLNEYLFAIEYIEKIR